MLNYCFRALFYFSFSLFFYHICLFFFNRGPDILTSKCSFQTATPSLKTRTEWCRSRRSSEPTTPPSRGPASGEPAGQPPAARQDLDGGGADVHVCACSRGWISARGWERHRGEWHKVVFKKKKRKKKQRKKWHSLSDVVEHCAFCDLKFFTVLTQPAGGNVCNHLTQLQSNRSIWKLLL